MNGLEFVFSAQVLGFKLKYLIKGDELYLIYNSILYDYLVKHNPVLPEFTTVTINDNETYDFPPLSYKQKLPDNLTVCGDMVIRDYVPMNLTCTENVTFEKSTLTQIPNDLKVFGSIDITNINITKLPDDYMVIGNIYIGTQLSDDNNFSVLGDVYFIQKLSDENLFMPESCNVVGSLSHYYT